MLLNEIQFSKIEDISFTFDVSKLRNSIFFNELQPENKFDIFSNLLLLKSVKVKFSKEVQLENI